jgi:hypothetical protein
VSHLNQHFANILFIINFENVLRKFGVPFLVSNLITNFFSLDWPVREFLSKNGHEVFHPVVTIDEHEALVGSLRDLDSVKVSKSDGSDVHEALLLLFDFNRTVHVSL